MNSKKIFIAGGAGYVGSMLVPYFLKKGHQVTVYDIMYFGYDFLPKNNDKLKIIEGDIRKDKDLAKACKSHDIFVNLACISNDTSFALDENLSKSINFDAFEKMVITAKKSSIKRFIYASSSSVYGVSKKKDVKEDHPLVPLTLYNKYKGLCEPLLFKHTNDQFCGVVFRPATVCGYAPRLRLDLSVNILTNFAVNKGFIKVFGGDQLRPNLHIMDYCDAVNVLMESEVKKVQNEIFNVGYQNLSIIEIANIVKKVVSKEFPKLKNLEITKISSDDNRSYHINSEKIFNKLGFKPKRTIESAIKDLCDAFKNGLIPNSFEDDQYFNVKRLKNLQAK